METTAVIGQNGANGVLAARHVTKVYSFGIEPVFLLNALMVKIRKAKILILPIAQVSRPPCFFPTNSGDLISCSSFVSVIMDILIVITSEQLRKPANAV